MIFCCSYPAQTSSISVEAEGIGRSQSLDIWGEFPKMLQLSANSGSSQGDAGSHLHSSTATERSRGNSPYPGSAGTAKVLALADAGTDGSVPSTGDGPCLDLVAAVQEAPLPLLRPVLLLTLAPMYTITSQCNFPIKVRQAIPGPCHCSGSGADDGDVNFMVELAPRQTRPLVWQRSHGSRAIQLQG